MEFINSMWSTFIGVIKSFQVADALDVIVITFIIYKGIQFIRKTRAEQFAKALLLLVALWAVSYYLQLHMTLMVLNTFLQFGVVALVVLFQPELRSLLEQIGRTKVVSKYLSFHLANKDAASEAARQIRRGISAVVESAVIMQRDKTGALIVFERETKLGDIIETGTLINAVPSVPMIGNIFFNKAPLHDGAMIVRDGMIYAAGCILPLTRRDDVDPSLGTRHRAAIGMSENSDAVVVVVSEETGQISMAIGGNLVRDLTRETLSDELENLVVPDAAKEDRKTVKKSFRKEGKKK
ncbi:MAG: diadenylate cyclase CdaA [Oscillospiraceae bacterium]|nr:diadenylate cyclase CdaA [Oscillospiraceae bacterium]